MDPSRLEMNPYQYAVGNPVMFTDPSGLISIIREQDWLKLGGPAGRFSKKALEYVRDYNNYIQAAAVRHYTAIQAGNSISEKMNLTLWEFFSTLRAVLYMEAWGYFEADPEAKLFPRGNADEILSDLDFIDGGGLSYGPGQIRPDTTALELENAGLIFEVFTPCGQINLEPIQASIGDETAIGFISVGGAVIVGPKDVSRRARIDRLLDPIWAAEYTAANMHQSLFDPNIDFDYFHPVLNRNIGDGSL